ncbi:MAG: patatin-like phospholipase family protein [Pseudomonadota bacterium]
MTDRQTVSLVLGSGGARGLAHIGVIEQLTQAGYEIRSIAGASMGALIGGIYAMGKLDVYTRWVTGLDKRAVFRLLDFSFGRAGLVKGDRIMNMIKSLTGEANIEDLPIRFVAIATDLEEEKEVWFERGSLFDAIRASIAIPTIVMPHRYQGRQYLDGSLVNPIPITATLHDETDLTVVVDLGGRPENLMPPEVPPQSDENNYRQRIAQYFGGKQRRPSSERTLSMFDVVVKAMSIMENTIVEAELKIYRPDIVIEIPRDAGNFYEFYRARELIEVGRRKAAEALLAYAVRNET